MGDRRLGRVPVQPKHPQGSRGSCPVPSCLEAPGHLRGYGCLRGWSRVPALPGGPLAIRIFCPRRSSGFCSRDWFCCSRRLGIGAARKASSVARILATLAVTAWLEFAVNVRPLNLVLELVSVPFLVLLFGTLTVSELRGEDRHTSGFILGLAICVVLFFLGYTLAGVISDPDQFLTFEILLELTLPVSLTLGLVPFVYGVALVTTYGTLFARLNWQLKGDTETRRYAKRRVLQTGHVRLRRAHKLAGKVGWWIRGRRQGCCRSCCGDSFTNESTCICPWPGFAQPEGFNPLHPL